MRRLLCILPLITISVISSLHCMANKTEQQQYLLQQLEKQRKRATGKSLGTKITEKVVDAKTIASTIEAFYNDLETNHNKMFQKFDEIDTDDSNNESSTEAQKRDKLEDLTQGIFSRAQTQKNIAIKAQNYLELHKNRIDDNSHGKYYCVFNEYNMEAQRAIKWAGLYLEFRSLEKDYKHYIDQTKTIQDRQLKYDVTTDPYYKKSAGRTLSAFKTILDEHTGKIRTKVNTLKEKLTEIKEAKDVSQETLESLSDVDALIKTVEKAIPISTQAIRTDNKLNVIHDVNSSVILNNQVYYKKQILSSSEEKVKSWDNAWLITRLFYHRTIKQKKQEAEAAKKDLRTTLTTLENFYSQRNINTDQEKIATVRSDIEQLNTNQ